MVEHQVLPTEDGELPIIYVTEVIVEEPHTDDSTVSNYQQWGCPHCTLVNPVPNPFCGACENPATPVQQEENQTSGIFVMFDDERNEQQCGRSNVKLSETSSVVAVEVTELIDAGESPWEKKTRRIN